MRTAIFIAFDISFIIWIRYTSYWCFTKVFNFQLWHFTLSLFLSNPRFICSNSDHFWFWFFHKNWTTITCQLHFYDFTISIGKGANSLNHRGQYSLSPFKLFIWWRWFLIWAQHHLWILNGDFQQFLIKFLLHCDRILFRFLFTTRTGRYRIWRKGFRFCN